MFSQALTISAYPIPLFLRDFGSVLSSGLIVFHLHCFLSAIELYEVSLKWVVMDRVEIIVDSSSAFWRHFLGRLALIWSHRRVRICFVITLVFYLIIAIAITEVPQHKNLLPLPAFVILGMWLTPIAGEFIGSINDCKTSHKCIIHLDCNGVEMELNQEHNQTKVFYVWENFYGFRETRKRFILFAKKDNNLALAKRYMSQEKISTARTILDAAPLEKFT